MQKECVPTLCYGNKVKKKMLKQRKNDLYIYIYMLWNGLHLDGGIVRYLKIF